MTSPVQAKGHQPVSRLFEAAAKRVSSLSKRFVREVCAVARSIYQAVSSLGGRSVRDRVVVPMRLNSAFDDFGRRYSNPIDAAMKDDGSDPDKYMGSKSMPSVSVSSLDPQVASSASTGSTREESVSRFSEGPQAAEVSRVRTGDPYSPAPSHPENRPLDDSMRRQAGA